MPKPVLPKRLKPKTPAGTAAGKLIDAKTDEVLAFVEAACAGDTEGLHSLRVAVKRLRETLRLFQRLMPPRERKRVLPLMEELNDGLGRVRDRDVLIEHARELAEAAPGGRPAIEAALAAWQEQRRPEHVAAIELWERLAGPDRLVRRLRRLARGTRRRKTRLGNLPLERFAYVAISARLERTHQRLAEAQATTDPAALHRLRIVVKRLKYTLEPFLTALPALQEPYKTVAEIQETLGLAHDSDVLEAALTEFFHAPGPRIKGTTEALGALQERREALYATARGAIGVLGEAEWERALLDAVD
jgi:CHAD domain-containing protein